MLWTSSGSPTFPEPRPWQAGGGANNSIGERGGQGLAVWAYTRVYDECFALTLTERTFLCSFPYSGKPNTARLENKRIEGRKAAVGRKV